MIDVGIPLNPNFLAKLFSISSMLFFDISLFNENDKTSIKFSDFLSDRVMILFSFDCKNVIADSLIIVM